jgi:hypothetical protein
MKKRTLLLQLYVVLAILTSTVYLGCELKADKTNESRDAADNKEITSESTSNNSETKIEQPGEKMKITTPGITGNWSGTFDKRSTVLTITEQIDSNFSGKISISYRDVINQEVKGSFSPTTNNISMKDQLHSRYQGKYNGKLSKDGNKISGTFTMDLDGKQFSFNLIKK